MSTSSSPQEVDNRRTRISRRGLSPLSLGDQVTLANLFDEAADHSHIAHHTGIDLCPPAGTAVLAAQDGTVVLVQDCPGWTVEFQRGKSNDRLESATPSVRALLRRLTQPDQGALGAGFPPGSLYEGEVGTGFGTLRGLMYRQIVRGRRLSVAAFNTGWHPGIPAPGEEKHA